jgi:hypothetical protein
MSAGHRLSAIRCSLPWSSAALQGLEVRRTRTVIGSARPVRRFDALRVLVLRAALRSEDRSWPLLRFRLLRRQIIAAPHRSVTIDPKAERRPVPRCCLSWAFVPYDTISVQWTRLNNGDGSLRHRVPRPGFEYPHRDFHPRTYRRSRRRSVHGLCTSRCSPRARVVLLSEPVPS